MKQTAILILSIAILATSSYAFSAKKIMYKWTDELGEVHYSERAPKDVEYTKITTYIDEKSAAKKAPEAPLEAKKEVGSEYNNWKQENCTIATQNLEMLRNTARIGVDDGDGGKRLMTDEEKQEKIDNMVAQQTKYCEKEE